MSEIITREDLMVWALSEVRPYLKRGYTTYIRSVIGSVIMRARNEFPGYQMDLNDPDIPAHVHHAVAFSSDGTHQRIQQLERLNATLAAQVDRQARVVDAAIEWKKYSLAESDNDELLEAIIDYERQMAQLTKDDA